MKDTLKGISIRCTDTFVKTQCISYTIYFVDNSSILWVRDSAKIQLQKASLLGQRWHQSTCICDVPTQNQGDFCQWENGN